MTTVLPPDPGDQWAYFNAMAALGSGGELVAPPVEFSYQACAANLSGSDDVYQQRCPLPWVNVDAQPTPATARALFPYDYFVFLQRYVRVALSAQPPASASAKAKILWLLDVQSVATLALMCLNIPLKGQPRNAFLGLPDSWADPSPVLKPFTDAQQLFYDNLELARYAGYDSRQPAAASYKAELDAAKMAPAAFGCLPVFWLGNAYRQWKGPDPVYARLFGGFVPTAAPSWYSVPSPGSKDSASLAAAQSAGDAPLARGIYQWRMWCARDGIANPYVDPSIAPLGLGTATNTPNLVDYITHVQFYEKATPELVLQSGRLYPNFAHSFAAAARIGAQILNVNYPFEIRKHIGSWVVKSSPKVDDSGNPPIDPQTGNFVMEPVTYTDNDSFLRGLAKDVAARAKLAIANPGFACGDDKTCQAVWSGATVNGSKVPGMADIYALAQKSPLGPFIAGGIALASLLIDKFGAAIGGGYWPFYVIEQPFVRTFVAAGYRTVPDGSSADVVLRIVVALQNIQALTGLALLTPPAPLPPLPASASAALPSASLPTSGSGASSAETDSCAGLYDAWAQQQPEQARCMTPADRSMVITYCHASLSGRMTAEESLAAIKKTIADACARNGTNKPLKILAALGVGLTAVSGAAVLWKRRKF